MNRIVAALDATTGLRLVDRVRREMLEPQSCEALEIGIEAAEDRTVLDGEGGKVRVTWIPGSTCDEPQVAPE